MLYAPTRRRHREYDVKTVDLFPFEDFSYERLEDTLETGDILLLVRMHPNDHERLRDSPDQYQTCHEGSSLEVFLDRLLESERIRLAPPEVFPETVDLLPFVDSLVTDYSTIYHTFLLLDRPLLFIPYDYDTVKETFDFKYDYLDHLPGPAIDSFESFEGYASKIVGGGDPHAEERQALREKLYEHPDGHASQRLYEFIRERQERCRE